MKAAAMGKGSGMSEDAHRDTPRTRLTGRGAVVIMLLVFALGLIGAIWLGWPAMVGASFVVGSSTAVFYVRTRDLLVVTVVPPLMFAIVLLGVKAATATGSVALSIAEGAAITLAGVAPWLFAGMALSLIIAWKRGLRRCVRQLGEELRPADLRPGSVVSLGPRPVALASGPADVGSGPADLGSGPAAQDEPSPPLAAPDNVQSGPAA